MPLPSLYNKGNLVPHMGEKQKDLDEVILSVECETKVFRS